MKYTLSNGVEIPSIGFGTWQIPDGQTAFDSVYMALEAGYRHIDTAAAYGNENSVIKAIKAYGLKREEVFITTKIPAEIKTYEGAKASFNKSLELLESDYVDLMLIHAPWPWSNVGMDCSEGNIEVWKALVEFYNEGKAKAIGVSNFNAAEIENIVKATGVKPMANQIRYFVGNTLPQITKYCQENDILVEAYSPLATGALMDSEIILNMAEKYNTTPAKICIRFCIQNNTLPLPKSTHKERINANLDVDFE